MNHPLDVSELPTPGATRLDLVGELQTAVGEVARACRSNDPDHLDAAVAAILRMSAAILISESSQAAARPREGGKRG